MSDPVLYLDGEYIRTTPQVLNVWTPGQQNLHGVFETMRSLGGKIELLDEHMQRLMKGLRVLKIKPYGSISGMKRIAARVVKENPAIKCARVRVMVFKVGAQVHCAAMVLPYTPSMKSYRVAVVKTGRPAHSRHAEVKSLDYGVFADAYTQARAKGFDEALLLNDKGHVFEASRANVLIVLKGRLLTPPLSSGCLNGIVRRKIIAAARRLKVPVAEENITLSMVQKAEHAFLTNSLIGLAPFKL